MLEIAFLILFCRHLGSLLRGKGRDPFRYQLAAVLCWFGGEVAGAVLGLAMANARRLSGFDLQLNVGICAFVGAALTAILVYSFAVTASPRPILGRRPGSGRGLPAPELVTVSDVPAATVKLRFTCPNGHLLEDAVSAAGQLRRCGHCHSIFHVSVPV